MKNKIDYLLFFIGALFLGFVLLAIWESHGRVLWAQISLTLILVGLVLSSYNNYVQGRAHLRTRNTPEERAQRISELDAIMKANDSENNTLKK